MWVTLYPARSWGFFAATRLENFFCIRDEYSDHTERSGTHSPRYRASGRIQLTPVIWFGGMSFRKLQQFANRPRKRYSLDIYTPCGSSAASLSDVGSTFIERLSVASRQAAQSRLVNGTGTGYGSTGVNWYRLLKLRTSELFFSKN